VLTSMHLQIYSNFHPLCEWFFLTIIPTCSFGWWLMACANLFWEKNTAGWLLMTDLLWE
jgi:hypothetical protein